ncbi:hypothetical protein FSP39_010628 [Pinctada imbricata]|uniref:SAYSvFN domain-containing protein n=1 Tax=Pinctada imbricata TaxID=66713 RepID=A0AA88XWA1_PINIB|nr:hypothetical protein FSP39_010628 [Pinctada imbricata]
MFIYFKDPNASGTADKCQHDVSTEIVSDQNPEITDTKRKSNLEDYTTPSEQYVKSYKVIWIERILKFLLWLLLWLFFIEYQFGVAYFITSLIVIVYLNTRTGPRDRRHLSAYSVFNPNFERIDGTFTAEQFEKELIYGAGSVKKD